MDNGGSENRARKWPAAASRNAKGFAFAEPGGRPRVIEAVREGQIRYTHQTPFLSGFASEPVDGL